MPRCEGLKVSIQVRVPPILRGRTGGQRVVEAEGPDVAALLDDLDRKFPSFKEGIFTADGQLHRFINLYLNDEDIRFLESLQTRVSDGDVVAILPAVAGG